MKKNLSVLVLLLWVGVAFASTAGNISKNVNSLIRSAENKYFNGEINEAATMLLEVEDGLVKLKSEDPAHKSIKTLQTKYDRLKARVDKKLGNNSSKTAPKAKAKATPGIAQSSPAVKALSHGAKNNLKNADREMDFAEQEFAKGEKKLQDKEFNLVDSYIYNAKSKLDVAEGLLGRVINSNKANPDHPDVASAFQRHKALQARLTAFTGKARGKEEGVKQAAAQAKGYGAKLNNKWLPKITPFTDGLSNSRLQYPGSYNEQKLDRQEKLYDHAVKVLGDVEKDVPVSDQPDELKSAVDKLRFSLQVYEDDKKADNKNRLQPIENTLSGWEKRFEKNRKWNEKSDQGLFAITKKKLEYQKKQIGALGKVFPDSATGFSKRLEALEKENISWVEKKRRWLECPRPFPKAKMKSKSLEKKMARLLKDRDIKVKDLVIVDKDWWIQRGEFRYMTTAVLSKDKKGKYWSKVSFRQIQSLTGYGPTEIWKINEIRIRLP